MTKNTAGFESSVDLFSFYFPYFHVFSSAKGTQDQDPPILYFSYPLISSVLIERKGFKMLN